VLWTQVNVDFSNDGPIEMFSFLTTTTWYSDALTPAIWFQSKVDTVGIFRSYKRADQETSSKVRFTYSSSLSVLCK
jgi:hypothetical protein